jgi:hypothetical protein
MSLKNGVVTKIYPHWLCRRFKQSVRVSHRGESGVEEGMFQVFILAKRTKKTIQFESHKVELPFIYSLEHSDEVLEFYDQPPAFKINYQSLSGRRLGFFYTPDFFIIRKNSALWCECKTEKELQKLAVKQPERYVRGEDGCWLSPPASEYALNFYLTSINFKI